MDKIFRKIIGLIIIQQLICIAIGLIAFIPDKCPDECNPLDTFLEIYIFSLVFTFTLVIFVALIIAVATKFNLND